MTKQKKTTAKPTSQAKTAKRPAKARAAGNTKLGQLEAMLRRPQGATIPQLTGELDWQALRLTARQSADASGRDPRWQWQPQTGGARSRADYA